MKQPTIAELEAIMAEKNVEIDIRPNGEVYVKSELQDAIQRAEKAEAEAGKLRKGLDGALKAWDIVSKFPYVGERSAQEWRDYDAACKYIGIALAAALQDGTDTSAPKLRENCIAYPTKLPERPTCVWLSDGRKIGIQREGGAVWLRIENAATVIPATPDAADIDAAQGKG